MLKLLSKLKLLEISSCSGVSFRSKCFKSIEMAGPKANLDLEVERILWIDMEMTGLDIERDQIMEVAAIVTDSNLNIIAEGPHLIINQPKELLDDMNDWCKNQHNKTGLTEACLKSELSIAEAETRLLKFVEEHTTPKTSPLGGNSVYMDRLFLRKFMKKVDQHLHYRIIDVSTIKELCRRWNLDLYRGHPKKSFTHRAMDDIKESIEELRFYKEHFFKIDKMHSLGKSSEKIPN